MIERFRRLAPREQLVLGIGTVLAIMIISWSLVWAPLRDGASELDASIEETSRQVVDLRRAANLSSSSATGLITQDASSLIVLVDQTARPIGLASAFTRTNQDGADAISVTFRDARFDRLIGWLIELEQVHGVAVVQVNFSRTGSSGLVSGQVRLDRS